MRVLKSFHLFLKFEKPSSKIIKQLFKVLETTELKKIRYVYGLVKFLS